MRTQALQVLHVTGDPVTVRRFRRGRGPGTPGRKDQQLMARQIHRGKVRVRIHSWPSRQANDQRARTAPPIGQFRPRPASNVVSTSSSVSAPQAAVRSARHAHLDGRRRSHLADVQSGPAAYPPAWRGHAVRHGFPGRLLRPGPGARDARPSMLFIRRVRERHRPGRLRVAPHQPDVVHAGALRRVQQPDFARDLPAHGHPAGHPHGGRHYRPHQRSRQAGEHGRDPARRCQRRQPDRVRPVRRAAFADRATHPRAARAAARAFRRAYRLRRAHRVSR